VSRGNEPVVGRGRSGPGELRPTARDSHVGPQPVSLELNGEVSYEQIRVVFACLDSRA
jgi:hypothetical protein